MANNQEFILAVDQGTTNTKAILVNRAGEVVAQASIPLGVNILKNGWIEQDPHQIWMTVINVIDECLEKAGLPDLAAVALTNQRETVLMWERSTGKPLGPAVVWQCHRTADFCKKNREKGLESKIRNITGLTIDPMFSGSKMNWLMESIKDGFKRAQNGEICFGTVDSWMLWNLTGGSVYASDFTNASRTQLLNLRALCWDDDMLDIFNIPIQSLPKLLPSSGYFGETFAIGNLPSGVPITSMIGDSHSALYGHTGFIPGSVKATYGTGSSLMIPTESPIFSKLGLSTSLAWVKEKPTYALEGNIYVTGAAVKWLGDFLRLENPAAGIESLAGQVSDTNGVFFVPAFVGLGAPHWNESARGLITGITGSTKPAHLALATLEAIAFQIKDVYDAIQLETGSQIKTLLADGGASSNNLLMQIQADLLGIPVIRDLSFDLSAVGAAYLAGLALGFWTSETELLNLAHFSERFEPRIDSELRRDRYVSWQKAIKRTTYEP